MSSNMTLAQLRALVAVSESGGFTAAALRLGSAQSTLSQAVGALESSLGLMLFARTPNGIVPTAAGRAIVAEAKSALEAIERISAYASEAGGIGDGVLRIAAVRSAARRLLPPVLAAFQADHPRVAVTLLEGSDTEVGELVRTGVAEIGLGALGGEDLASAVVAEDPYVLVAKRGHRLLGRGPVSPAALDGEPFVMSSDGCEPLVESLLAEARAAPIVIMRVGDMATLLTTVREGLGVSIVPELALPDGDLFDLRTVPVRTTRRRRLLAIEPISRTRSRAAEAFFERLKAVAATRSCTPESARA